MDQCKNCVLRGNIRLCVDNACSIRDSWYAQEVRAALEDMVKMYAMLINSGDCGHWDPETDKEVIASRKILGIEVMTGARLKIEKPKR